MKTWFIGKVMVVGKNMSFGENMVFDEIQTNLSSNNRCICEAVDDNKHLLLFCFIFQEVRQTMLSKIISI